MDGGSAKCVLRSQVKVKKPTRASFSEISKDFSREEGRTTNIPQLELLDKCSVDPQSKTTVLQPNAERHCSGGKYI